MPRADRRSKQLGRYRKVYVRTWTDERFLQLSAAKPNAQTLWLYLLTGPHTTAVPGIFVAGQATLAEALDWPLPALRRCFAEIEAQGMAFADWKRKVVWLPEAPRYNPPESLNTVIAWRTALAEIPACELRDKAEAGLRAHLSDSQRYKSSAFLDAFTGTQGNASGNTEGNAEGRTEGKACPMPTGIQEQEQEQIQEQEHHAHTDAVREIPGPAAARDAHAPAWRTGPRRADPALRDLDYHRRHCPTEPFPWASAACDAGLCVPKYLWPQWQRRKSPAELQAFVAAWAPRAAGDRAEAFWPRAFEAHFGVTAPDTPRGDKATRTYAAAERVIARQLAQQKAVGDGQ